MVFIITKENSSKTVHKLKSFYSVLLNKMTKLTELSTLTMHHSVKKNKQDQGANMEKENMVS